MNTGRKVLKFTLFFLTIAWIVFIFSNSFENGIDSAEISGNILAKLNSWLSSSGVVLSEHLIRKSAHFLEFSILGILLLLTTIVSAKNISSNIFIPLFFGLLVPVADESIQLFVDGRASQVNDILLDFAGVIFGLAIVYVFHCVFKPKGKLFR